MIDGLIRWSLHHRLFILTAAGFILIWGGFQAYKMPVDVFPDLTAPTVTVIAEAHGMAPEEVETQITFPIETALNGASGVRRVRSSTSTGIAVVYVEFHWGMDIYRARQIVSEKLQLVRSRLPSDIDPPVLAPISSIMGEIMFIALTSDRHDPRELKTMADWTLRQRILAVPGVSQVIPIGGETKQFQIVAKPERLSRYGMSVLELVEAVRSANENVSAGFYKEGGQEYLIHGVGRIRNLDDIRAIQVKLVQDQPILIGDLAEVRIGNALKRGDGALNGKNAVIIGIQKQPQANTLGLTQALDRVLLDAESTLPEGMVIHRDIFRQADFIQVAIKNVFDALRDGSLLVVFIVLIFLASGRATAITVLAIPLSLVVAVIALKFLGTTINTMTLGGMAIAIGALVDDAIIDVENVTRRLRENHLLAHPKPVLTVVFEASKEIRVSIVFATVIIVLVFLPLFFLTGVEGRLLRPLGFAYMIALAASLFTALTVTPVLCSLCLAGPKSLQKHREAWAVSMAKKMYHPVLNSTVQHWKSISWLAVLLLIGAMVLLSRMGQSFLPDFNEGTLTISAVTLPGTSLEESNKMGQWVEDILLKHPEVVSTARRTGRSELDEHAQGINASELEVNLLMQDRSKIDFLAALREDFKMVPGTNITIGQPISHRIDHMLSGTRANIAIKIFGDDLTELRKLAAQVQTAIETVAGVVDLSTEQQAEIPFLTVQFDRQAMARAGITMAQINETLETAFLGHEATRVLEGQATFDVVVRMEEAGMENLDLLRETLIVTPTGAQVPLHALAHIRKNMGASSVSRENVRRKMVVMCNVAGRDLTGVVRDIQSAIKETLVLPAGYHIDYGGQFESAQEASRTLLFLGSGVILGIFVLLFMALGTARDAALVMVNLPLALIGGVIGVYLSGSIISVASIIGFITLFGIATRNGILLVSHIHHLMEIEGVPDLKTAVIQGAMERLAPILMTALSAALALIPLAMKAGLPGGEIEAPMAVVILCGLFSSTLLNVLVVPALYLRFGSKRHPAPQAI